jgi:hypothetical protein
MFVAAVGAVAATGTIAGRAAVGTLIATMAMLVLAGGTVTATRTVAGRPAVNAT